MICWLQCFSRSKLKFICYISLKLILGNRPPRIFQRAVLIFYIEGSSSCVLWRFLNWKASASHHWHFGDAAATNLWIKVRERWSCKISNGRSHIKQDFWPWIYHQLKQRLDHLTSNPNCPKWSSGRIDTPRYGINCRIGPASSSNWEIFPRRKKMMSAKVSWKETLKEFRFESSIRIKEVSSWQQAEIQRSVCIRRSGNGTLRGRFQKDDRATQDRMTLCFHQVYMRRREAYIDQVPKYVNDGLKPYKDNKLKDTNTRCQPQNSIGNELSV